MYNIVYWVSMNNNIIIYSFLWGYLYNIIASRNEEHHTLHNIRNQTVKTKRLSPILLYNHTSFIMMIPIASIARLLFGKWERIILVGKFE